MIFKCTQKLLSKLGGPDTITPTATGEESRLGNWYANSFSINHKQFVLFLSEKTHLSIVLTQTQARDYKKAFPYALSKHLAWLGIPLEKVNQELDNYYRDIQLTKTDGPRNVQYLNSYVMYAKRIGEYSGIVDPIELTRGLAEFPTLKPLIFPDKDTLIAFGEQVPEKSSSMFFEEERLSENETAVTTQVFRFRIELDFEELVCWREVVVPSNYSFLDFHIILQNCFNWLDYHLFDFTLTNKNDEVKIAELEFNFCDIIWPSDAEMDYPKELEASDILLSDVFPKTKNALYSYDYGDGWDHKVRLMETIENYENDKEPFCVKGFGDAPPEDVGGEGGFINFLETITNAEDPEYDFTLQWGKSQQFERFDLEKTNAKLSKWRNHKRLRETS